MEDGFAFPEFYGFPPYFTLQPVDSTREKQAQLWRELVLRYCAHHKKYVVSVDADADLPLFHNRNINRKLDKESRTYFLNEMVKHGEAESIDKSGTKYLVYWKKPEEWADLVLDWVKQNGISGTVMTLDEITNGPEAVGAPFQGMHRDMLLRVLGNLEAKGRVKRFKGAEGDDEGVKFF